MRRFDGIADPLGPDGPPEAGVCDVRDRLTFSPRRTVIPTTIGACAVAPVRAR